MNFRDTPVDCQECGTRFILTVEKQRDMAQRGLEVEIPELCQACTQKTKYGGRFHGRIKWFSLDKGYGFVVQDDGSELFLHRSGIPRAADGSLPTLEENQEVLYEVNDTPKGPQAVGVTLYSDQ